MQTGEDLQLHLGTTPYHAERRAEMKTGKKPALRKFVSRVKTNINQRLTSGTRATAKKHRTWRGLTRSVGGWEDFPEQVKFRL